MSELPDYLKVHPGETDEAWALRSFTETGGTWHCLRCGSVIAGPEFRLTHFKSLHDAAALDL